jgi:hypothetical protein
MPDGFMMYPPLEADAGTKETCRHEPHEDVQDLGGHRPSPLRRPSTPGFSLQGEKPDAGAIHWLENSVRRTFPLSPTIQTNV